MKDLETAGRREGVFYELDHASKGYRVRRQPCKA